MLHSSIAQAVVDHGLFLGADFTELFIERHQSSSINLASNEIDSIQSGIDFGIGIRLFFGKKVLYGYTNRRDQDELLRITTLLAQKDQCSSQTEAQTFNFIKRDHLHPVRLPLSHAGLLDSKVECLKKLNQITRAESEEIVQVMGSLIQREQEIEIFNSEGLHTQDTRHYIRLAARAVAQNGNEQAQGYEAPGALRGWEFEDQLDLEGIGHRVAQQALTKLYADRVAGQQIDEEFLSQEAHEATKWVISQQKTAGIELRSVTASLQKVATDTALAVD